MMKQEQEWIALYEKLLAQQEELADENKELRDKYISVCEALIEKQEDEIALYQKMLDTSEDLTRSLVEVTSLYLHDPDSISDEFIEWFDEWLDTGFCDDEDDDWTY